MAYRVELTPRAARELADLPRHVQRRVVRLLELLADDPRRPGTRQLQGRPELRRAHAGRDYVVVYTVRRAKLLVLVIRVAHRRDVSRNL
jgi:mRNA interferase RelE/StbE